MRLDLPFWTWVLARRIPFFALVTSLVMAAGASVISRHVQTYMSTAELVTDPALIQTQSIDRQTQFEFLKFRALTSGKIEQSITELNLENDPLSRVMVRHDAEAGKITVGYHDRDPQSALLMTRTITRVFLGTAQNLALQDAQHRINRHETEAQSLLADLNRLNANKGPHTNAIEESLTRELYQKALADLAVARADASRDPGAILSISRDPALAAAPSGPNKRSMYLALVSFAIFCGLVTVVILEWLDTIIRRPHDIEATLGFATFGVIPDLQLQPIETTKLAKRGL